MSKNLSPEKIEEYRASFKIFDKDEDGKISTKELKSVLNQLGKTPSQQELDDIISEFDQDGNGTIEFEEFVQLAAKMDSGDQEEENLKNAFEVFDKDGNGYM
jgi:calmodulin